MDQGQLGRSGVSVTAFGLGCGNFGGIGSAPAFFGQGETEREAFSLLDRALEVGINYLDTADAYGGGRSEAFIGRWLSTKDANTRDRLLISSKVGNIVDDDATRSGLSRRHIVRQVEESLARLGIDHLDMYLAHEVDADTPLEETVAAFDEVIRAGKVRAVGISNHDVNQVAAALQIAEGAGMHRFEWVQNSFNLIDQAEQASTLDLCREAGLGFTPFGPLGGGWLTGKYRFGAEYPEGSRMTLRPEPYLRYWTAATFEAISRLGEWAADLGVSTAGLALAWLRHHPSVTSSIVGPRRPAHYEPVLEAMSLDLTPADHAALGALFNESEG